MSGAADLLRQIHPIFVKPDGKIGSSAFRPSKKDNGVLSVYDGRQMTPVQALTHYTTHLGLQSRGVRVVTQDECEGLNLVVVYDGVPFPAHAGIDFNRLSKSQQQDAADDLRDFAEARGWAAEQP